MAEWIRRKVVLGGWYHFPKPDHKKQFYKLRYLTRIPEAVNKIHESMEKDEKEHTNFELTCPCT